MVITLIGIKWLRNDRERIRLKAEVGNGTAGKKPGTDTCHFHMMSLWQGQSHSQGVEKQLCPTGGPPAWSHCNQDIVQGLGDVKAWHL